MAETRNRGKAPAAGPKGGGGRPRQPARRTSPLIITLVAILAVVVVGALAVVILQNTNQSGSASDAQAEGTRKGPADAKVQVLIFSDFQ